jgi:hypothetical protein
MPTVMLSIVQSVEMNNSVKGLKKDEKAWNDEEIPWVSTIITFLIYENEP